MADGVFSLKHLFTTAALALAIDLLIVFPISHFSVFGKAVATNMAQFYGFISTPAELAGATAAAAGGAVSVGPAATVL